MGRLSERKTEEALRAYFEEGLEPEEIAARLRVTVRSVLSALGDKRLLEPYHRRSEAAKLRAQICVNESAEEAARRQAELMRNQEASDTVSQRAAKDILDRAGVRVPKEDRKEITITFTEGMPDIGMPKRGEDEAWS
ncbi:MAG: hypothetical protein ACI4PG_06210 [Candidatus Ventricola sp.]